MDKVHTRPFDKRILVNMNEKFQPSSDDDKVVSGLGYFLGTLKRSVPPTYKSWRDVPSHLKNTLLNYVKQRYIFPEGLEKWVMRAINVAWRGYKSRLKDGHYTAYSTDEERLETTFQLKISNCSYSIGEVTKFRSRSRKILKVEKSM